MEYVDGENLDDLIERRAFSVDETLNVFAAICEAVAYIHRHGIVHRDIKSQNVKLTVDGAVKLLDFGIAKDATSDGLTLTGGLVGTPNYLSPEQLEGRPATPRSDVWALGVLLYEMLTGVRPFVGDNLAGIVLQITTTQIKSPEKINPVVPREAANIVKKCLKKDPASRYASVDELLRAVRSVVDNMPRSVATLKLDHVPDIADELEVVTQAAKIRWPAPSPEAKTHRSAAPQRKGLPLLILAGAGVVIVFVLAAAVGVGYWALSGKRETVQLTDTYKPGESNSKSLSNGGIFPVPGSKSASTPGPKPDSSPGNKGAETPKSTPTPAPSGGTQRIRIDLDEGQAQVSQNGRQLGTTPLDIDVSPGESPNITLHRDGYEDKQVTIEAGNGKKVFTFSLKRKN